MFVCMCLWYVAYIACTASSCAFTSKSPNHKGNGCLLPSTHNPTHPQHTHVFNEEDSGLMHKYRMDCFS